MKYHVSRPCIGQAEKDLVNASLDAVQLSCGPAVRKFESILAEYLGARYVVATSSGTTALHLALVALGIGPGDEVLVPDMTFVATANAVAYTGAKPVLVDINPATWCMNSRSLPITSRTKAIIPVHLYGVACDMTEIDLVAAKYGLHVIEDAAEGFTGTYHNRRLGTLGKAGVYSFFGNKIITTGEGGAVSTDDQALYERLFFLRGQALDPNRRYYHPEIGFNYRLTDLQGSLGVAQMGHLEPMLAQRRAILEGYRARLCRHGIGFAPEVPAYTTEAPWLFSIRLLQRYNRDRVMAILADHGIETRPGFVPLHRLPMYSDHDSRFPVASRVADQVISLPTHPGLSLNATDEISTEVIRACMESQS